MCNTFYKIYSNFIFSNSSTNQGLRYSYFFRKNEIDIFNVIVLKVYIVNTKFHIKKHRWIGDLNYRVALGLIVVFFASSIFACGSPPAGAGFDKNKLIDYSPKIFLVQVTSIDERTGIWFRVLETVKYDWKLAEYYSKLTKRIWAWNPMPISSYLSAQACHGAFHMFSVGKTYLLFPDLMGAKNAAEIIRSKKDHWYLYVKHRVKTINSWSPPKLY